MKGAAPGGLLVILVALASVASLASAQEVDVTSAQLPPQPAAASPSWPPTPAVPRPPHAPPHAALPYGPTGVDYDLMQREQGLRIRFDANRREQRALAREGRPPLYVGRLVLGFGAFGLAGGTLATALLISLPYAGPHSSDTPERVERASLALLCTGAVVALLGAYSIVSARRDNLNRSRLDALEDEHDDIERELRALRHERKLPLKYGVAPSYSQRGAGALVTLALTL